MWIFSTASLKSCIELSYLTFDSKQMLVLANEAWRGRDVCSLAERMQNL